MKKRGKLWAGRFEKTTAKIVESYSESISFDNILYKYDIEGSIAHVKMLTRQRILNQEEKKIIINGLKQVKKEIETGILKLKPELEDIHMNIEERLIELTGREVGGKLHTARSRNDQVLVDIKLYLKDEYKIIKGLLLKLLDKLLYLAEKNKTVIIPGFTHLQHAQPVLFSHYILAYFQKFKRDLKKLNDFYTNLDECPLGAAAFAGTSFPIDRNYTARLLGFTSPTENSIDTVSDRDFALDTLYLCALISTHLSRITEDFIIWNSQEFNFIEIDDAFTTGSSIMPNKKNPDICELIRSKPGQTIGNLNALFIILKGLPLSYNRDLQDDKLILFRSIEIIKDSLNIFAELISNIKLNRESISISLKKGFMEATDIADYLSKKGIPFREAHEITGNLVNYASKKNKTLLQLTLKEFKRFSNKFNKDIISFIKPLNIVNRRKSYGGTSLTEVNRQIKNCSTFIKKNK